MLLSGKFCVQNELVRKLSWIEAMPLDMDLLESTRKGSAALIYYSYGLLRGNQRSVMSTSFSKWRTQLLSALFHAKSWDCFS